MGTSSLNFIKFNGKPTETLRLLAVKGTVKGTVNSQTPHQCQHVQVSILQFNT